MRSRDHRVLQRRRLLPVGATDRDPSERRAFGTLSKWPCERVKPPSVEHKVNDGCGRGADRCVRELWCIGKSCDVNTMAYTPEELLEPSRVNAVLLHLEVQGRVVG